MLRLVQLQHPKDGRRVGMVADGDLALIEGPGSIYALAMEASEAGNGLEALVGAAAKSRRISYDPVHRGESEWRLLPAFDHPGEPGRCLVTGTGLTHKASAQNRQAMHAGAPVSDSMRMYQSGLEGGRPAPGQIGSAPEWFYKGDGAILRAHGERLEVPPFAMDGGEESEVAGAYAIGPSGEPWRVGLVLANEFSDHKNEKQGYLYLAASKLRTCSIGPELIVGGKFDDARGAVRLWRNGAVFWTRPFATGESNMSHSVANLEHHHFKYPAHRRPGDVHIHFFGADVFSFGEGIELRDGDEVEIELAGFGRALRNPVKIQPGPQRLVKVGRM